MVYSPKQKMVISVVKQEEDQLIWSLLCKGVEQPAIARMVGLSATTVAKRVKQLYKAKSTSLAEKVEEVRTKQLGQYEYMLSEVLDSWRASRVKDEPVSSGERLDQDEHENPDAVVFHTTFAPGDVSYLEEARAIMQDIRDLLGMNALPGAFVNINQLAMPLPDGDRGEEAIATLKTLALAGVLPKLIPDRDDKSGANGS